MHLAVFLAASDIAHRSTSGIASFLLAHEFSLPGDPTRISFAPDDHAGFVLSEFRVQSHQGGDTPHRTAKKLTHFNLLYINGK
eukprot:750989-Hanusia_phi.AAC.10